MLLLIRLQRCESMFPADLVADQPHPLQRPRREAQLLPGVRLDGVDDEVGVEVCRIDVGRHQHLAAGEEFLSQLQRDLMSLLRADLLLRRERLDVLVEEGPGCFVVEVLGRHESIAGQICHAIDAGEVTESLLVHRFLRLRDIAHHAFHRTGSLLGLLDETTHRHG